MFLHAASHLFSSPAAAPRYACQFDIFAAARRRCRRAAIIVTCLPPYFRAFALLIISDAAMPLRCLIFTLL